MKFETIKVGNIVVMKAGRSLTVFDISNFADPAQDIPSNAEGVIIDLSETNDIDSAGIGVVMRIMNKAKSNNQKFSVVVSNNKVLFVMKLEKLDTVLPISFTLDEAISKLREKE